MGKTPYARDLSDSQWQELTPLLPIKTTRGHPGTTGIREAVNAIRCVPGGRIPWPAGGGLSRDPWP